MRICKSRLVAATLIATALLTGCAFGNTHNFGNVIADIKVTGSSRTAVATQDQRYYVVSGRKTPDFVGLQRAGFGNPYDVTTENGGPLAEDITKAVSNSLKARGFDPVPVLVSPTEGRAGVIAKVTTAGTDRIVLVIMKEWKTDTYRNVKLVYDLELQVLDRHGEEVASKAISSTGQNLGGSAWNPPAYAREEAPRALKEKIEILLNDSAVAASLQ